MNYVFDKNTYFAEPKSDVKDKIQVEIGDSKQVDFIPQVKMMRWDNECNVSIRLKESESGVEKVEAKAGKIAWSKGNLEANFYDLNSAEHPEGAYEFDITLKTKPATNKIEFTLVDKDVEYFYQPALTQAEIDEGASRPENVIGSYAIYAKTQKTNWTGGKEYKCGKIGHIYRPLIIDSKGEKVWGELHIENGLLTVTIPQSFLDAAVYPILVDPTFGYTTQGASSDTSGNVWLMGNVPVASGGAGTIDKVTAYMNITNGTGFGHKIVITDNSYNIITNGVSNARTDLITGGSQQIDFTFGTPPSISSADYGLFGIKNGGGGGGVYYDAVTGGWADTSNDYTTPTSPTDGFAWNRLQSIYATYTASGGGDTIWTIALV